MQTGKIGVWACVFSHAHPYVFVTLSLIIHCYSLMRFGNFSH